ncbi:nuclear transport factor 2 family protein, partial [Sedimentimonas flavescens]|uniref:nuclear transport factor 2 family protein n=1 Tax=Sedimentimonas flavescens TaxID=2851012 RepID=UPI001C4A2215
MSMFEKVAKATESRDVDAYAELLAEDFVFVRHQNGTQMNKPETIAMLERMMSASRTNMGQRRCLYENDDILVLHSINDYPGECQVFCVWVNGSMLLERSQDDDDFQ